MCGIVGIYNFSNKVLEKSVIKKMCEVIYHRGPDEEGFYLSEKFRTENGKNIQVGLGIRRLAIIDLLTGSQPIHNEDKTIWIVCNGEIYNFLQLNEDLQKNGHKFYTKSDVEVIVHLYEEFGIQCLNKLGGMFAFILWDEKNKILFIARDRVGKKPLYYTFYNNQFIFASEIKSILQYLDYNPEINYQAIDFFLTLKYIPAPLTIYKNIFKFPQASFGLLKDNNFQIQKYWDLDFTKKQKIKFYDATLKLKDLLSESTKIRLISDVPLGAFLSGGIDSSIIVGIMSQYCSKVKTFSVGFKEQDISELKYAKVVAEHFNTDHTEIIVEPNMIEILPKLIWYYDQPFADTSMIPSYYISNITRKYVKVALNGDGGDENFCGYLRYVGLKISSFLPFEILGSNFYKNLNILFSLFKNLINYNNLNYLKRFIDGLGVSIPLRNFLWHSVFNNEFKNLLYSDEMKKLIDKDLVYKYLVETFLKAKAYDVIDKISYTDINTYLPEDLLVKMDIASMANSLEARSPFLDYKLLEFTSSLPSNWKLKYGFKTKYILRETFKNFIPQQIFRRHKQGFGLATIGIWFRKDLKNYIKEILLSKKFLNRKIFNHKFVNFMLNQHFLEKQDYGEKIFSLIVLELWFRIFVDKEIKIL